MNTQHTNSTEPHDYNSTQSALKLPEYGRMIQHMVDYALTIENKEERQRYAEAIATIMLGLNPKMKEVPGFKHKVWDHLAYMSDYKLDINYPFEISKKAIRQETPNKLPYPKGEIRFRHYGRLLEQALNQLTEMEANSSRENLTRLIANRMKRNLADWKGDGIQDAKVAHDIAMYTNGKVAPDFQREGQELMHIGENRFRTRKNKGLF
ncbi:MAG: DUF4290 domain-containing protein [Bacteroidales bacterium]|nr:DUF4290 domain-containing protein [Bacteroidales bacterium]MDD6732503.1 DUF4290 domain-containing protein [Bacteroidales bacterium]